MYDYYSYDGRKWKPPDISSINNILANSPGGIWKPPDSNFDNIAASMLTLIEVSTLEGWIDVMFDAMDISEKDKVPITNASWS